MFYYKEKATLLEKVEHYERDIQINRSTTDAHRKTTSAASRFAETFFGVDLDADGTAARDPDVNVARDFEFYYERNVRP